MKKFGKGMALTGVLAAMIMTFGLVGCGNAPASDSAHTSENSVVTESEIAADMFSRDKTHASQKKPSVHTLEIAPGTMDDFSVDTLEMKPGSYGEQLQAVPLSDGFSSSVGYSL